MAAGHTHIGADAIRKAMEASKPQKKEPEMVEVFRFMDTNGKEYWAKKAKTPNCVAFPMQSRLVEKGSKEDQ